MATNLFVSLCSVGAERRLLLEISGPGTCDGNLLAGVLANRYPGTSWFLGATPLAEVQELPGSGEIHVADMPMDGAPHEGFTTARTTETALTPPPTVLVVVAGPDPGGVLGLSRGTFSLGRGENELGIGDPLLSRRHALIHVSETSITVSDEGSANGLWFAGARIQTRRLLVGDSFRAGGSTFGVMAAQRKETGREPWPLEPIRVQGREPSSRIGLLLVGALTPLAMGIGLYLVTRNAFFLAFSAVSALSGGLPSLFMFRARRAFGRATKMAERRDTARIEELAAPLGSVAAGLRPAFTTAPDGLPPLVLGKALLQPWTSTDSGPGSGSVTPSRGKPSGRRLAGRNHAAPRRARGEQSAAHSPVLLRLGDGQCLAFEGTSSQWAGAVRAVLVRWLPLLAAGTLRVVVSGPADFLPAGFLMLKGVEMSDAADPALPPEPGVATIRLVVCGSHANADADETRSGWNASNSPSMEASPRLGAPVVWIHCGGVAGQTRAQATVSPSGSLVLTAPALAGNPWLAAGTETDSAPTSGDAADSDMRHGLALEPAALGFCAMDRAIRRILEPGSQRLAGVGKAASAGIAGADLPIGHQTAMPPKVQQAELGALIGDAATGPVMLDLFKHGPHFLVAGTTGSGKSELLRSLVLGLASNHGPDELAFMLVDFKGGATLSPLAGLPHVQHLVSDLDAAAARRVLEQLTCELHRRESLLAAHHATDLAAYLAERTESDPLLPSLVVVVDEFRVFATELPGALENIVQLATVGRSLGIHLVLSTQRPSGTLNAQLRANISTVVALRTVGEFESSDLIGSDVAARLDPSEPGWAFMRCGSEKPLKFRVRVNARARTELSVRAWGAHLGGSLWQESAGLPAPGARSGNSAVRHGGPEPGIAAAVREIVDSWANSERAQNPFSPALSGYVRQVPRTVLRSAAPTDAIVGLVDRVDSAHPGPMVFNPGSLRRLAVCGQPGSGIEAVPELLVRALNQRAWTTPIFVLDGNGTQQRLAQHPGVRGYFGPQDSWRIQELIRQLENPGTTSPLMVLVSGISGWTQSLGATLYPMLDAALAAFARNAGTTGRVLVISGDRDLAGSRAASLCESRWYFPRGAGPELLMGWPRLKQVGRFPGRGLLIGPGEPETGTEFQLLDPNAVQGHPQEPVPAHWISNSQLPDILSGAEVRARVARGEKTKSTGDPYQDRESGSRLMVFPLGVCGPENRVFHWSPGAYGIVIGAEGPDRKALMRHLAASSLPGNQVTLHLKTGDRLPMNDGELAGMARALGSERVGLVVIDAADARQAETARSVAFLAAERITVLLSIEPASRVLIGLGLGGIVSDPRSFVVLDPRSVADADPTGFRFTPDPHSVSGRALVMDGGTLRQIQCVNCD